MDKLRSELAGLSLEGYRIEAKKVQKSGFRATKFDVITGDSGCRPGHHDGHSHSFEHGRNFADIVQIIENGTLAPRVRERSIRIFRRLAEVEARIHGTIPEKVHFHEVGAVDSIVDIVGAVICLELLEVERIIVSPLPLGKGFVRCRHGVIPVPAPAALELLADMETYGSDHAGETVTPTGAAILSTLADSCGLMPLMTPSGIGYGAGTRELGVPNLLRVVLGNSGIQAGGGSEEETVMVLEANIDDMNPEFFDFVFERLFENGALDVFLVPIQMKKNRPGSLVRVLCPEARLHDVARVIFLETSTIGIRFDRWNRFCLEREIVRVVTEYGEIMVKLALLDGRVVNSAPEYEDCREQAKRCGVSLKNVYHAALNAAAALLKQREP